MDLAQLIERIWDKAGAVGVIALMLFFALRRLVDYLEPRATQAFKDHSELVQSLKSTTAREAETNAQNSKLIQELAARPACQASLIVRSHETPAPQNLRTAHG